MSDDYGFHVDPLDIHIETYALRTFAIRDGRADSVVQQQGNYWKGGVCVAKCLHHDDPEHIAPMPSPCRCGIYGCLSIGVLRRQYPEYCARIITVVECEGKTMLGTVGLRTAAARVVAYWCAEPAPRWGRGKPGDPAPSRGDKSEEEICVRDFPDARRFRDVGIMARLYGLAE
jgi:hypothetical protein